MNKELDNLEKLEMPPIEQPEFQMDVNSSKWKEVEVSSAVVWEKQTIPKAWCRAGGVLIPKEEESSTISQLWLTSLLNIKGTIFFSVKAQRLKIYLDKNRFVDTTTLKTGISGISGCLEHTRMIWLQIQSAKRDNRDLHIIFLDLANAFGSVPHSVLSIKRSSINPCFQAN